MNKRAVCVGINDYPGTHNDLNGCVNDANDWVALFEEVFNFDEVTKVLNVEATAAAIVEAVTTLIDGAGPRDVIAVTYSGHGTWVYDQGERDESDNRDEAWCGFDGNILDDTLRKIIHTVHPEAHLTVISDSCYSGTVTRTALKRIRAAAAEESAEHAPKPRYMPPQDDIDALRTDLVPIRRRMLYPESDMREVLITGCNALEYSFDAYINGRHNGAMTAKSIALIRTDPTLTYKAFHKKLRQLLPTTRYPQSPQLEGSKENKNRALFT
jgi:hypothetical protein